MGSVPRLRDALTPFANSPERVSLGHPEALALPSERHGSGGADGSTGSVGVEVSTSPRSAANSASSASVRYSPSADGASTSALSDQEAEFHEASDHEAEFQDAEFQEALAQDAEFHDALAQDAEFQEAEFQEALAHEAEFQEAFACATFDQLAASKTFPLVTRSLTTNEFRPAFGFGALATATALATSTTPTPAERAAESPAGRAVNMSAPLT